MATSYVQGVSIPPKLDIDSNARGRFYQTPQTPSTADSLLRSTYLVNSRQDSYGSRKRSRNSSYTLSGTTTPFSAPTPGWESLSTSTNTPMSPAMLANSRYDLANGLDTPSAAISSAFEYSDNPSDLSTRHGRWESTLHESSTSYFPSILGPLDRERNGHTRVSQSSNKAAQASWTFSVLSTVGTVATRVLSFCTSVPFKGFYSGGGQGYPMPASPSTPNEELGASHGLGESWDAVRELDARSSPLMPSLPGLFPPEDFIPDYMSSPFLHTQPHSTRLSKKHKRESSMDSAAQEGWTLVSGDRRRNPQPAHSSASPASARRPVFRAATRRSLAVQPPSVMGSFRPASTAGLRSPTTTPKRRRVERASAKDDEAQGRRTPTCDRHGDQVSPILSPAAVEARHYAEMIRRKEAEGNRELKKLNTRLKDMIREGREALGTRVSIENSMSGEDDDAW